MTWRRPTLPRLRTQYHRRSRVFTAEFGMGSGVWPLAMTTRSSQDSFQDAGTRSEDPADVRSRALSVPGSWNLIPGTWRLTHARKSELEVCKDQSRTSD